MTRGPLTGLAVLAATGALAVAGCGGDDDSTSAATSTTALTAEQWASQADQICTAGDQEQNSAANDFFAPGKQPTDEQLQRFATEVVIPSIEAQIDGVAALPRPEDEADQIQEFIDQANSDLDALKDDPSVLTDGSGNPFADTTPLAKDLGLTECAS
jgi:hypothetical protein